MAIDSTQKKMSLIGFGGVFCDTLPYSDGSLDEYDLQHLLDLYGGSLLVWTAPDGRTYLVVAESRLSTIAAEDRVYIITMVDREYAVVVEDRVSTVEIEDRTSAVAVEDRVSTVAAEDRVYTVPEDA
jgi:hypothetical protein